MGLIEIFFIGVGLAMDAFAVAVCKGLNMKKINFRHACIIALFFGGFQALMPLIGWLAGCQFESYIDSFDHWIAFILLVIIGGRMAYETLTENKNESCKYNDGIDYKELFMLAIATSIDALAVGITFAFLNVNIRIAVTVIGITTFILSFAGVAIGNKFGSVYKKKAEIAGGVVLILIGLKILLEHLGVLNL